MCEESHRFTAPVGAPEKSSAVSSRGIPADVPNLGSPCSVVLIFTTSREQFVYDAVARHLHVNQHPVAVSVSPNAFCERLRVWVLNCR